MNDANGLWYVERTGKYGESTVLRRPDGRGLPFPQQIGLMAYMVAGARNMGRPLEYLPGERFSDFKRELLAFLEVPA